MPSTRYRLNLKGWQKIFHENENKQNSWGSNTILRQNRLQNKGHNKRQIKDFT